jgi:hypothetical protein
VQKRPDAAVAGDLVVAFDGLQRRRGEENDQVRTNKFSKNMFQEFNYFPGN